MSLDVNFDLKELSGIGPAIEGKLKRRGINNILDLAASTINDLVDAGIGYDAAVNMSVNARAWLSSKGFLDKEFLTAEDILERRKEMMRLTTTSKKFDEMLGGGIETQAITEFYGPYGAGKTQLCHILCIMSQMPREQGGLDGSAIYIDTESTFRPERAQQIAEARDLDPSEVLRRIYVCQVYNSSHLELMVRELGRYISEFDAKLAVVDSVISHFRAEYLGRGTLADRQQRLNYLLHRLLRIAEVYNVAVVVTNQVQAKPDAFYGDPTNPAGGHVLAHACTYRLYLKRAGKDRIARIVDSPYHPDSEIRFRITDRGVEDVE